MAGSGKPRKRPKEWYERKTDAREYLVSQNIPCGACDVFEMFNSAEVLIQCGANAASGDKDISSWISLTEARLCPGRERRTLYLGAPAHYAARRQESS